ncbi:hypothetical protein [Enterococcus pingfangensis]|uniref:hypothetical protein n=2 Tax=Lactobacillales TaxID=186826 RepID=UPI001FEAF096|nr:hypothetical protein [Enterococcus pingfangensis]
MSTVLPSANKLPYLTKAMMSLNSWKQKQKGGCRMQPKVATMPLQNTWIYTKTTFDDQKLKLNTGNQFILVSQRPYSSKKNPQDVGVSLTLQVVKDDGDYGVDKKTGMKRDNNVLNTFDVTILNNIQRLDAQKGDIIRLGELLDDKTFIIGFDIILRYKNVQVIKRAAKQG